MIVLRTQKLMKPERGVNESFAAYKSRRSQANYHLKQVKRGKVFWNSYARGTYIRPITA